MILERSAPAFKAWVNCCFKKEALTISNFKLRYCIFFHRSNAKKCQQNFVFSSLDIIDNKGLEKICEKKDEVVKKVNFFLKIVEPSIPVQLDTWY